MTPIDRLYALLIAIVVLACWAIGGWVGVFLGTGGAVFLAWLWWGYATRRR